MLKLEAGQPIPSAAGRQTVEGVVLPAGEAAARSDSARQFYYATETNVTYCARHPQVETLLRCGRCEAPICPRCMVHSGVGIRCPDCAANPRRTIGEQAERAAAAARGKAPPKDTGFRNYWHKGQAFVKVEPKHYILATLAGLGAALALGLVWGFMLNATPQTRSTASAADLLGTTGRGVTVWSQFVLRAVANSLHLIPEIVMGVLVGEAIGRIVQNRVGTGLQVIAGASFVFGILVSIMTVAARMFNNLTGTWPGVDALLVNSLSVIGQMFSSGTFGVILFWAAGVFFAALRLKR